MSYAVMPMADYKNVCDKVREKTNTTEVIKSGEMAEKVEEVYAAGQLSVWSSSEKLRGRAEGNPVSVSDVSKVEHQVEVTLSAKTLTDLSHARVTVCGKNLFNKAEIVDKFNAGEYETSDDTNSYSVVGFQLKPNTKYMVKICGVQNGSMTFINYRKKINSTSGISVSTNWSWTEKVMTTDETGKMYVGTYGATNIQKIGEVLDIALVQVEEGTVATEYEEYREQTYISNADGIVEGVKSIYPSMNISADAGITISAEYYKDIDKVLENLAINTALSGGE